MSDIELLGMEQQGSRGQWKEVPPDRRGLVRGGLKIEKDLEVEGALAINGGQTVSGGQSIHGQQAVDGDQSVDGDQAVTGSSSVAGNSIIEGATKAGGTYRVQYLTGGTSKTDLVYQAGEGLITPAVGDTIEVSAYSPTSPKCPAVWECTAVDAEQGGDTDTVIYIGNAAGGCYKFEMVGAARFAYDLQSPAPGYGLSMVAREAVSTKIVVTVGPTGDFATINDAIRYLEDLHFAQKIPIDISPVGTSDYLIVIQSDFVMAEQVLVRRKDLSWLEITSNLEPIPVIQSALNAFIDSADYPVFGACNFGTLPLLKDLVLEFDGSGSDDPINNLRHGVYLRRNSRASLHRVTIKGAGGSGLFAEYDSSAEARGCNFPESGAWGIAARHSSTINGRDGGGPTDTPWDLTNCGTAGVYASQNSRIYIRACDTTGSFRAMHVQHGGGTISSTHGITANSQIRVENGGVVNLDNVHFGAAESLLYIQSGGKIFANNVTCDAVSGTQPVLVGRGELRIWGKLQVPSSAQDAVYIVGNSTVSISELEATGAARHGLHVRGSRVSIAAADVSGAGHSGVYADLGSSVEFSDGVAQECGDAGIRALNGSHIDAIGAQCECIIGSPGNTDIRVSTGSTISAVGAVGGTSQTPNEITSDGIIFK